MRILLLCHSFNSLTQRLHVELREAGHAVSVEFDVNDAVTREAVALFKPDLVIAPFLKRAIPEDVWRSVRCLIVHPGVRGDKGPCGARLGDPRARADLGRDADRGARRDGRRPGVGVARIPDARSDQGEPLSPRGRAGGGRLRVRGAGAAGGAASRGAAVGQFRPRPAAAGLRRGRAAHRSRALRRRGRACASRAPPTARPARCSACSAATGASSISSRPTASPARRGEALARSDSAVAVGLADGAGLDRPGEAPRGA